MAIEDDLNYLRTLPAAIMDRLVGHRSEVRQVELDTRLSQQGRQEQVDAAVRRLLDDIDQYEADAKAARERVETEAARRFRRDDGDPARALLDEMRTQRSWQRIKPLLDATETSMLVQKITSLVQRASEDGDLVTLRTLDEELDAYLEARGVAGYREPVAVAMTKAMAPHLSAPQREALAWRDELAAGWPRIVAVFNQARLEARGQSKTVVLPGWRAGEQVVA